MSADGFRLFHTLPGVVIALLLGAGGFMTLGLTQALAVSATDVDQLALKSYERDLMVSEQTAEEHLKIQARGAGVAEQLEKTQGESYAGVWFDNAAGEFVIPTVSHESPTVVAATLRASKLGNEAFRTVPVQSTWEDLEAAHQRVDQALLPLIEDGLAQTSLDPRTNAVVIYEVKGTSKADQTQIQSLVANEKVNLEVRPRDVEQFIAEPLACNTYNTNIRVCDKPLRAGVYLGMSGGNEHCTAGFKAIGNVYGNRFMLTAGHCGVAWLDWESRDSTNTSHYVGHVDSGAATYPGGDWAAVRVNGYGKWWEESYPSWPSVVVYWGGEQNIPIQTESASYLGEYVCHSGTESGSSCGYVTAFDKTQSYGGDPPVYHLTEVSGSSFVAIPGDSGGPVWAGNTALGILSGAVAAGQIHSAYYAEVTEAADALGVSVGTRIAAPPSAETGEASGVAGTQAIGNGKVDPNGISTSYHFEYGTTTAYGSSTQSWAAGSGFGASAVSGTISGLQPVTTYQYRLVAGNTTGGVSFGFNRSFTTTAAPPIATTEAAEVKRQEATLKGNVNPQGASTTYRFEYGLTTAYGKSIPTSDAFAGTGISGVPVSQKLSGLEDATYHYRVVGINSKGTTFGADREFIIDNKPLVTTEAASGILSGSATLNGKVEPQNFASTFHYEIVDDDDFKVDGFTNAAKLPLPDASAGSGFEYHTVSQATGVTLEPETTYHFRLVATNVKGTRIGSEKTFRTAPVAPVKDFSWGKEGSGNGEFSEAPTSVAVDSSGNVWVADIGNERLEKFNSKGEYLSQFGKPGAGEFWPTDVALTPGGNIWVSDLMNDHLQEFSPEGTLIAEFGKEGGGNNEFNQPRGIAIDMSNGNIWVSDYANGRVQEFNASHEYIRTIKGGAGNGPLLVGPRGITLDKSGNVWVVDSDAGRVVGYTPTGTYIGQAGTEGSGAGQLMDPRGVAFSPSGFMFVTDSPATGGARMQEFSTSGEYLGLAASVQQGFLDVGLAVSGNVIYVPENAAGGICQVTKFHIPQVKATSSAAQNVVTRRAKLAGTVNPNGSATTYRFEYGLTKAYGNKAPTPDKSLGSQTGLQEVLQEITGLMPNTTYHYRLAAFNSSGASYGEDKTLKTTIQQAPAVTAEAATAVAPGEATINASVNPNEAETTYQFQYGKTAYGKTVPVPAKGIGSGSEGVKVSEGIKALEPNTTYHFRVSATNEAGTTYGEDKTFTTPRTTAAPTYSFTFGKAGTGNGQLGSIQGVEADGSGNVWVADADNSRIQKFNSKGEYLSQVGSKGSGNGQFKWPSDVAIDSSGNVWVVDQENSRIQKFNSKGEYLSQVGSKGSGNGQLYFPTGIAIDAEGNLWVTDSGNNRVEKFNSKGEFLLKAGGTGSGNGQLSWPQGIAIDPDGNAWVVDTEHHRIQKFNSKGEYLSQFGSQGNGNGQFFEAFGIAIDPQGTLWVADPSGCRIQAIFPEGEYVTKFGKCTEGVSTTYYLGVATDPEGNLWVGDRSRVTKWIQGSPYPVLTGAATALKRTEATLNATINPGGVATNYQFQYGTTTSLGTVVPASPKSIGLGSTPVKVSEALNGLRTGTTYYYRVVATTASGTTYGEMRHLTTTPGASAEAKWRVGGKTFAELGLKEESFFATGSFAIAFPSLGSTLKCSETSTGTLAATGPTVLNMTLKCEIPGAPACKLQPISLEVDGKFKSLKTILALIESEGCGILSTEAYLPNGTGAFEIGDEAAKVNVTAWHTTSWGLNPVYITGSTYWQLNGANAGKAIGLW
jgi:DNA-binding beta-propeller fold protein YncE/phosphodiesterase/alkaline phosphatase D-like protein